MTTQTVGQAGVEVLSKVTPEGVVSNAGVEVLFRVNTPLSISQTGIEILHRVTPVFSVTQAGVEYLHKAVPCTTRWAQVWTITRTDGEVFRFTSLDRDLIWNGASYGACDSLVPSATEGAATAGAAGNMDLSGAVASGAISQHALAAGLFDGASVEAYLIAWDGFVTPRTLIRGTFGAVQHSETGFTVEILGDGAKLTQTPLVRVLQPDCRWQFGDPLTCGKDLGPLTVTGTVDIGSGARGFTDAARAEVVGYFSRGHVTFTTGDNAGIGAEIKEHHAGGSFTLWPCLAFPISAGDQYSMTPGCTNLQTSSGGTNGCDAWDNFVNFGGFPWVPGADKATAAADVK